MFDRYKEKKKLLKKLIKAKRPRSPLSSNNEILESISSDSDVPLSTLKGRRRQLKKVKKSTNHHTSNSAKSSKREDRSKYRRGGTTAPVSTVTSSDVAKNFSIVDTLTTPIITSVTSSAVTATSSLPSCSRYNSTSTNNSSEVNGTPLNLVIGNRHEGFSCDSVGMPTCSKYQTHSQYKSTSSKEASG